MASCITPIKIKSNNFILFQIKCERYWPLSGNNKMLLETFTIQMLSEKAYANFAIHHLKLINRKVKYWGENGLIFVLKCASLFVSNFYSTNVFFMFLRFSIKESRKIIENNKHDVNYKCFIFAWNKLFNSFYTKKASELVLTIRPRRSAK